MKQNQLESLIIQKIKAEGPIPFDEFMKIALYFPESGYYMRKDLRIGKQGDFFTASHLGRVFGILLTRAIERFWEKMGFPSQFSITEIGPGMGYLAEDILNEITTYETFRNCSLKYNLIELNPELIKYQKERLKRYSHLTEWHDSVERAKTLYGVIICNEIFDALPVRVFEIKEGKPLEVYVDVNSDGNLTEILLPARQDTISYLEEFAPGIFHWEGYRSEVNLEMKNFIQSLSLALERGYVLIFDYGYISDVYYAPHRVKGTLLCYHKHRLSENPYVNIGEQDITCHVNFSALKKWANEAGFKVEESMYQGQFLISLCDEGLLERFQKEGLIDKFKRLVLPQGMGETHTAIILSKS